MNIIETARNVLSGHVPQRLDEGHKNQSIATAQYSDVPMNAIHPGCKITQTQFGYSIEGSMNGCRYSGQAFKGNDSATFKSVLLSFVKHEEAIVRH
jgi:hypothetical protein